VAVHNGDEATMMLVTMMMMMMMVMMTVNGGDCSRGHRRGMLDLRSSRN